MAQNATKEARSVPHRLSYCSESNHQILRLWSWGGFTSTIVQFVLLFGVITSVCTLTSIFFQHINFLFSQKKHVNPKKKHLSPGVFFRSTLNLHRIREPPSHGPRPPWGSASAYRPWRPRCPSPRPPAAASWTWPGNGCLGEPVISVVFIHGILLLMYMNIYIYIKTQGGHTFYTALQDLDCQTKSNYAFRKNWNTPSESIFKDTHPYIPQGEPGQTQG